MKFARAACGLSRDWVKLRGIVDAPVDQQMDLIDLQYEKPRMKGRKKLAEAE